MTEVHDVELAGRVRACLESRVAREVREVRMFGGLSFMVDGRMVAAVRRDGELLLRVDPRRSDALVATGGARRAVMGTRTMSTGWLSIPADALDTDHRLRGWLDLALAFDPRPSAR